MTLMRATERLSLTTALAGALIWSAVPAYALDAEAFAARIQEGMNLAGGAFDFAGVEVNGDTIVLKSASARGKMGKWLNVGDLTFEGVSEMEGGGHEVDRMSVPDIKVPMDGDPTSFLSVAGIEITGIVWPEEPDYASLETVGSYWTARAGPITATDKGKQFFEIAAIELAIDRREDNRGVDMAIDGTGLKIDSSAFNDPKVKDALTKLGYTDLTGAVAVDLGWDIDTGVLDVREYSFNFDNVGTLDMTLSFSGLTLDFIVALNKAQQALVGNPDKKAAEQAFGITMLGMMQQLSFDGAEISFEDDSLTGRALDFAGQQQGVSGQQMGEALKGMLPLMLGQLGIPALQQEITAAVNTYLDDPKSLTISAEPENPVPFPQIMGAGMGDPRTLVDLLGVTVTANE